MVSRDIYSPARTILYLLCVMVVITFLSGCVIFSAVGTAVSVTASVVKTSVKAVGSAAGVAAGMVTGSISRTN